MCSSESIGFERQSSIRVRFVLETMEYNSSPLHVSGDGSKSGLMSNAKAQSRKVAKSNLFLCALAALR